MDTVYLFENNQFIGFNENAQDAFRFPIVPEVNYLFKNRKKIPIPLQSAWCQEEFSALERNYAVKENAFFALPLKSERFGLVLVQGPYQFSEQNFLPFQFPIALYFDNNQPLGRGGNPRSQITDSNYLETVGNYLERKNGIIRNATKGSSKPKLLRQMLEDFFEVSVKESLYTLQEVVNQIGPLLNKGYRVTITLEVETGANPYSAPTKSKKSCRSRKLFSVDSIGQIKRLF